MRFDAWAQIISLGGDYPNRNRTRASHPQVTTLAGARLSWMDVFAKGVVELRAESGVSASSEDIGCSQKSLVRLFGD
jgi:hypothetical protein